MIAIVISMKSTMNWIDGFHGGTLVQQFFKVRAEGDRGRMRPSAQWNYGARGGCTPLVEGHTSLKGVLILPGERLPPSVSRPGDL